jgi:hypothetical protein
VIRHELRRPFSEEGMLFRGKTHFQGFKGSRPIQNKKPFQEEFAYFGILHIDPALCPKDRINDFRRNYYSVHCIGHGSTATFEPLIETLQRMIETL